MILPDGTLNEGVEQESLRWHDFDRDVGDATDEERQRCALNLRAIWSDAMERKCTEMGVDASHDTWRNG